MVFGKVWTGDSTRPLAQAVATRGDTIVAVGDSADVARLVGEQTRVFWNPGGLVVPGFMDAHTHFLSGGLQLASVDLRDADSPGGVHPPAGRRSPRSAVRESGFWAATGTTSAGPARRFPGATGSIRSPRGTRSSCDGSTGTWGSPTAWRSGRPAISAATTDIPGGVIVRDRKTGEPTGVLKDEAMNPVYAVIPDPQR